MSYVSNFDRSLPQNHSHDAAASIPPRTVYTRVGKRALDVAFVLFLAPVVLLLTLFCAVAIRIEGGPAFFRQDRLGKGGRVFTMVKLRTMAMNADENFEAFLDANPEARKEWDHKQKLKRDPRVTRVGAFLRRTSLDELPQMWNVLMGDMSLIGPRPMTVEQGPLYPCTAYYMVRPGISGPWQVSDRHESAFVDRADFDRDYVKGLSFRGDLRLVARTVEVVLRCTGL